MPQTEEESSADAPSSLGDNEAYSPSISAVLPKVDATNTAPFTADSSSVELSSHEPVTVSNTDNSARVLAHPRSVLPDNVSFGTSGQENDSTPQTSDLTEDAHGVDVDAAGPHVTDTVDHGPLSEYVQHVTVIVVQLTSDPAETELVVEFEEESDGGQSEVTDDPAQQMSSVMTDHASIGESRGDPSLSNKR